MGLLIFSIGFFGLIAALVVLIIYAVKKKSKKIPGIVVGICLVFTVIGLFLDASDSDDVGQDVEEPIVSVDVGTKESEQEYEELTVEEITVLKKHYKDFTSSDVLIFKNIAKKGENLSPEEFVFYYKNLLRIKKEMKEFEAETESESEPEVFGLGEEVTIFIDGKESYSITFNNVTETKERNRFSDKDPEQVIIVDYTYKNIASQSDLYISGFNFKVIDSGDTIAETYPAPVNKMPQRIPIGTNCNAQEAFGLANKSESIKLLFYDNMFSSKSDAIFELKIN